MFSISISHDFKDLDRKLQAIADPARRNKAVRMALNKVAGKARTTARAAISQRYNMRKSEINPLIVVRQLKGPDLAVEVAALPDKKRGYRQNVVHFLQRGRLEQALKSKRSGRLATVKDVGGRLRVYPVLQFRIVRAGKNKRIRGAFVGRGGKTVFRRVGKKRLPIAAVQTVGVPAMFRSRRIITRVLARVRQELPVEIERAIRLQTKSR